MNTRNQVSCQFKSKRNNFLIKPQNDVMVLKCFLKNIRWIGITPFSLEANSFRRTFMKGIVFILMVIYIIFECINTKIQLQYDEKEKSNTYVVYIPMKIIWYLSNTSFLIISTVKPNFFPLLHWRRFFTILDEVEAMMIRFNFRMTKNAFLIIRGTFSNIAMTITVHVYHIIVLLWAEKAHKICSYTGWSAAHFYMVCTISILHLLLKIVHKRYEHLNSILKGLNNVPGTDAVLEVMKILEALKKLNLLAEEINEIFGLQMLLCILMTFTFIVTFLSYFVIHFSYSQLTYLALLCSLIYLVSIYFLIFRLKI